MQKYTVELPDDLAKIYEDLAAYERASAEEVIQTMLENVIKTMLSRKFEDWEKAGTR